MRWSAHQSSTHRRSRCLVRATPGMHSFFHSNTGVSNSSFPESASVIGPRRRRPIRLRCQSHLAGPTTHISIQLELAEPRHAVSEPGGIWIRADNRGLPVPRNRAVTLRFELATGQYSSKASSGILGSDRTFPAHDRCGTTSDLV